MAGHIIRGRMRGTLTVSVAAAVALSGCGGDDGDGGSGAPAVTVAAGKPLAVKANEYRFEPASLVVDSGAKGASVVTVELKNDGAVAHDLHVRRGADDLGGTPIFGPGQAKTAKLSLTPGSYDIFCSVGDHEALGMKGTLVLR